MASRKTSNQQRKRPECHTPDLTITPLINSYGSEIRAIQYTFQTENASGSERPGGVMWPHTPDGRVRIILSHTDKYRSESDKVSKLPFEITWVSTTESTNHSSLSAVGERGYSSNGYGANRSDYS